MMQEQLPGLLKRYFAQQTTAEETVQVIHWLAAHAVTASEMEGLMDEVWAEGGETPLNTAAGREILQAVFTADVQQTAPAATHPARIRSIRSRWFSVAASLLLLGSLCWWYARRQPVPENETTAVSWQQLHNTGTHVKHLHLADGSQVWLSPGSSLYYPTATFPDRRLLRISGEAYFTVAANVARPMSVLAESTVTHVLGTAFHIAAYPEESTVYVSLLQGKVSVMADSSSNAPQYLHPGQALTWNKPTGIGTVQGFDSSIALAATRGQMAFYELSLQDALQRVAHRFGLTIQVSAALVPVLQQQKVTGVFTQEKQEDMIRNILFVYGYHYTINGSVVTILP